MAAQSGAAASVLTATHLFVPHSVGKDKPGVCTRYKLHVCNIIHDVRRHHEMSRDVRFRLSHVITVSNLATIFFSQEQVTMADEKMEFETDVVTMADAVEVQTIAEGQALKTEAPDLDFIVQEEVETTTEGPPHLTEEDPVKNVLLSLQQSAGGGHDREEDMAEGEGEGEEDGGKVLEIRVDDDEEYSPVGETGRKKSRGSRRKGKRKKLSSRRTAISASPQDTPESGELKRSGRKWARSRLQVQTLATGEWPSAAVCGPR